MNLEKIERKRIELITDFNEEELINYVQQLSEKYYSSYFNNESESYNNTVKYLREVISLFKYDYPNLKHYINFCLVNVINKTLSENINSDVNLVLIVETSDDILTANNGLAMLCKAFEEGRENYHARIEREEKLNNEIKELKQENRDLKELLK